MSGNKAYAEGMRQIRQGSRAQPHKSAKLYRRTKKHRNQEEG